MSLQLHTFNDEPAFDLKFNYRSTVGKLNYLAQMTRPDIMYAMHQIAKYLSDPRRSHGEAILYSVAYLKKTHDLGLKFKSDPKKGFECYCDADFSWNWNREFTPVDPSTAKSRSVCVGYHTGKITLPVMPLTVPVTLPIPVMSAACTGTVRPFILRFF